MPSLSTNSHLRQVASIHGVDHEVGVERLLQPGLNDYMIDVWPKTSPSESASTKSWYSNTAFVE